MGKLGVRCMKAAAAAVTAIVTACFAFAAFPAGAEDRASDETRDAGNVYLFSYFLGNGEDGLHLAWSEDGLTWRPLGGGRSFMTPAVGNKLVRDPCLCLGPDGVFHLVWTTGWGDRGFGVAHSADLLSWSEQKFVPVMAETPGAKNCWAPEIIWDAHAERYLIYWSSTVEGRFAETAASGDDGWNHRIYRTATRDFRTYEPAELFYEPGFNCIDATIAAFGDGYVMVLKDETRHPPAKNLRVSFAERMDGPWSPASAPFTPAGLWVEGPSILRVGEFWHVYFDAYTQGRYGLMRTRDFREFEDLSDRANFPPGTRHGTALAVPRTVFEKISEKLGRK